MPQAKLGGGQGLRAVTPLKLRTTGDQDVEPILDGSWKMLFLLEMFYLLVLYLFSWKYTRLSLVVNVIKWFVHRLYP